MSVSLEPYTAVLMASYGGPDKPDDVLPFMRNATAGKNIPDERLLEVSEHYMAFGGKSPINERNAELMDALRAELERRGLDVPVVIGNRNWHPYYRETAPELAEAGHTRVVGLATSAYSSYSSCRQYREDLEGAQADTGGQLHIDKVGPFALRDEFAEANARALVAGYRELRQQVSDGELRVLFVTHSIPLSMEATSGKPSGRPSYNEQHQIVAEKVAELAKPELGEDFTWELVYCSRSGPPQVPWLEPDISDRIEELAAEGTVAGVVAAPIGFLTDHMEVVYDLDTEAAETAQEQGMPYHRAATVHTDPGFVSLLVDLLLERAAVARGEAPAEVTAAHTCAVECCALPPRKPRA